MTGGQLGGQQIASVTVAVTILTTILVVAAFLVPIIYSGKWNHPCTNFKTFQKMQISLPGNRPDILLAYKLCQLNPAWANFTTNFQSWCTDNESYS